MSATLAPALTLFPAPDADPAAAFDPGPDAPRAPGAYPLASPGDPATAGGPFAAFAADPRLAIMAQAVVVALVAALTPWLDRFDAALNRAGALAPALLSADEARAYCGGLAKSTWSDFDARGVIPAPVRVGGRVFWRRDDLDEWVRRECPGRARFAAMRSPADQPQPKAGRRRPAPA